MAARFQRTDLESDPFGGGICVALQDNEWALLEGTAVPMWELLGEAMSLSELTDALERRFSAPLQTIQADVEATLGQWVSKGIVVRLDS